MMICNNCKRDKGDVVICPYCHVGTVKPFQPHHLPAGMIVGGRYEVRAVLGEGGFGITYLACDIKLDKNVALKEYFPHGFSYRNTAAESGEVIVSGNAEVFEHGMERFLSEAKTLAKFSGQPGIVEVSDYLEENHTAYLVMEYLQGMTLKDYLNQYGSMDAADAFERMMPVINALEMIHGSGVIHRDISPDNIMIVHSGEVKLMDFGSAKEYIDSERSMSVLLKAGYAPEEQYRKHSDQGPWTDVYALCATIYRCITDKVPVDALNRLVDDTLKKPSQLGIAIMPALEDVLMYGLAVRKQDRCQSMTELKRLIIGVLHPVNNAVKSAVTNTDKDPYATVYADEDPNQTLPADDELNGPDAPKVSASAVGSSSSEYHFSYAAGSSAAKSSSSSSSNRSSSGFSSSYKSAPKASSSAADSSSSEYHFSYAARSSSAKRSSSAASGSSAKRASSSAASGSSAKRASSSAASSPAAKSASSSAAKKKVPKSEKLKWQNNVESWAALLFLAGLVFAFLVLFTYREYWTSHYETDASIFLVGRTLFVVVLGIIGANFYDKPRGKGASTTLIILLILASVYSVTLVSSFYSMATAPDEEQSSVTETVSDKDVSKIVVKETDSNAKDFQSTVDFLFSVIDEAHYKFPSYYENDETYKITSSDYYSTNLEYNGDPVFEMSSSVKVGSMTVTLNETTLKDLKDDGWSVRAGDEIKTDSYQSQFIIMENDDKRLTVVFDVTGDDVDQAKVTGIYLLGPAYASSTSGEFSYDGINQNTILQNTIPALGEASEYWVFNDSITAKYHKKDSTISTDVEFKYDPSAKTTSLHELYIRYSK